jgi:hypothetical protein
MNYNSYKYFNFIFITVAFSLLLFVFNIGILNFLNNPYDPSAADQRGENAVDLKGLSVQSVVAAKLSHGATLGYAHDVAIFGNSRAVMLGARHIETIRGRTFFNFSVGGTAFQQSVRSLEYLANHGKAPRIAVISYDNAELQFVGIPYWPQPVFEIVSFFKDVVTLLREDYGTFHRRVRDSVKVAEYFFRNAWHHVELLWNFERLLNKIVHFFALWCGEDRGPFTSLRDGSRTQEISSVPVNFAKFRPQTSAPRAHNRFFLIGLRRLARLAETYETRIIIYESPLAPPLARKYGSEPTKPALETRHWVSLGCADSPLECHPAPIFETVNGQYWPDCCHAPADKLGAFISGIIASPSED